MNRLFFPLILLLLMTSLAFASQTYVIGEMFTSTTCGYCTPARSALAELYDNIEDYPFFIPLIWQSNGTHTSPYYQTRQTLYGFSGIPSGRWGGSIIVHGYAAGQQYERYVNAYSQVVVRNAPMELTVKMETTDENEITVTADVLMTGNITTTNNNIIFVLTYDLTGISDPNYFASVKNYYAANFPLNTAGQEGVYGKSFPFDETWEMERLTAVVFVQNLESTNPIIHQAGYRSGRGITSLFSSNVQQGPPSLHIQFTNNSGPAYLINSYEWDLDGDGEIDSTEENPSFIYDEPGTYSVTLTVSDGVDVGILEMEDYITVLEPDNVYGSISGVFKKEYAPYKIVGDVFVPADGMLVIEPGLEIEVENSAVSVEGTLIIDANFDDPVIFTSNTSWEGLRLIDSNNENIVKNTIFTKATDTAFRIDNSTAEIFCNNIFSNNNNIAGTGALEINESELTVENCLFINNSGETVSAINITESNVDFINNTVTHNIGSECHILNHSSYLQVKNSIIRGDGIALENTGEGMILAEYSSISGGFDGLYVIDEDPLFDLPSDGSGSEYNGLDAIWHLQDGSPCIDSGNPASIYNDPEDPANPGLALFPAKGGIRNDMGAYGGSATSSWVNIDDSYTIVKPSVLPLITAYPNPFNPNVTISLSNGINNALHLAIYNTRGQLVKTILNNEIPNRTEFFWNGVDNNYQPAPSGIYLIKLSSQGSISSHKILLLK